MSKLLKRSMTLVCASLLATMATVCMADAKSEIQAQWNKAMKFMEAKNFDGAMSLCTKDCTFKEANGQTMTVQQMMGQAKQEMAMIKSIKAKGTVDTCAVNKAGNEAHCTGHDVMDMVMTGP